MSRCLLMAATASTFRQEAGFLTIAALPRRRRALGTDSPSEIVQKLCTVVRGHKGAALNSWLPETALRLFPDSPYAKEQSAEETCPKLARLRRWR